MPRKKRTHREASRRPGQAICGAEADKLTTNNLYVDCGTCRKMIDTAHDVLKLLVEVGKHIRRTGVA